MENQEIESQEVEKKEAKQTFKKIGYALFYMLLGFTLAQTIMITLLYRFLPGIEESPWYIGLLIAIPFYCIGFPIFLWSVKGLPDGPKEESKKMSIGQLIVVFLISMATVYIFNIVGSIINAIIAWIKGSQVINPLEMLVGASAIIPTIIFVGILSPIVEEVIFRGVLLDKLRGYGERRAICFTALTFALFHGNLSQFFYAFALGLILAYITIKTNTIRYAIIIHILINIFGSVIMPGLILSGSENLLILGGIIIIIFSLVGSILFVINFKKIELEAKNKENYKKVSKKTAYANRGMLLYYLFCLLIFASVIFS